MRRIASVPSSCRSSKKAAKFYTLITRPVFAVHHRVPRAKPDPAKIWRPASRIRDTRELVILVRQATLRLAAVGHRQDLDTYTIEQTFTYQSEWP
jgi:hypothetical protein